MVSKDLRSGNTPRGRPIGEGHKLEAPTAGNLWRSSLELDANKSPVTQDYFTISLYSAVLEKTQGKVVRQIRQRMRHGEANSNFRNVKNQAVHRWPFIPKTHFCSTPWRAPKCLSRPMTLAKHLLGSWDAQQQALIHNRKRTLGTREPHQRGDDERRISGNHVFTPVSTQAPDTLSRQRTPLKPEVIVSRSISDALRNAGSR
jgi:hypothetical protein